MENKRFAVMGTGRSGTEWTRRALGAMGLRVGHEDIYDWKGDSGSAERWADLDGDVSLACVGYPDLLPVVRPLVVRHPLSVARSFLALRFWHDTCECHEPGAHLQAPYERFILERCPQIAEEHTPLGRSIVYQALWLESALSMATSVWTLDDLASKPRALAVLAMECGAVVDEVEANKVAGKVGRVNLKTQAKQPQGPVLVDDLLGHPWGSRLMEVWMECVGRSFQGTPP